MSNAYQSMIWNNTQLHLSQLGFNAIKIPFIPDGVRDKIYRFDNDKLAYVQYVTDNSRSHQDRKQSIINDVLSQPEFAEHHFLDITFVSSMGENSFFSFNKTDNSKSIGMPIHDFDTLIKLKDYSAIDLWNYSIAHEKQFSESTPVMASFLDVFKIFKENDDSFYISDKNTDMQVYVEPGYATDLYQKAKLLSDEHSALRFFNNSNRLTYAPVVRKEASSPVSYCPSDLGVKLELLVDGFFHSIWVSPTNSSDPIPSSARGLYYEITDAIAYWLWQCQHLIKNDLESLGDTPISVTFNLNPEKSFDPIVRSFERDSTFPEHFNITVTNNNSFNISIPKSIIPYLYGADNEGERILLKKLLMGFNELLTLHLKPIIQDDRISSIINEVAPLGVKKKVFILDTSNNLLLDPSNLEKHRYIQSYNVNVVLDNIAPELGALCPPTGNITEKEDKTKLTRNIVMRVLLPKLSSTINQYQHKPLLKKLIGLNESLIRKREDLRLKTPTRIACFVSVEKQTVDLQEELAKLDQTTIAVRCLIEHIAAEPCTGNKILTTTAIDELIAIMNQIITWGSLGDQIEYDLFDVKLSILPSRRVGTIKTLSSAIFDPYYASKSKEKVQGAIDTFNQCFPKHLELDTNNPPEYLENAFFSEFGATFTRICEFINDLGIIAYQQSTPFAAISKSQLFKEINAHDPTYTEDDFNLGLDSLCLFNKEKVYKIPG